MLTAWTFPGQGSQYPVMGRELLREYPLARESLRFAEEVSGIPLDQIRLRGPSAELRRPQVAEPLLTVLSVAYASKLMSEGLYPDLVAGYSAGETAALFAAGVVTLENAIQIAILRGRILEEYVDKECRMVTVARLPLAQIEIVLKELNQVGCEIYMAARNGPYHATLVGNSMDVARSESILGRLGGEIGSVQTAGMWHTNRIAEGSNRISKLLESFEFSQPVIPILTSSAGMQRATSSELIHDLALGPSQMVRWDSMMEECERRGVERYIECGPGRVLFGLMRWSLSDPNKYQSICVEGRTGGMQPLRKIVIDHKSSDRG